MAAVGCGNATESANASGQSTEQTSESSVQTIEGSDITVDNSKFRDLKEIKADVEATDEEKALAQELIDRSPTQDDVVTKAVVEEGIKLIKEKYDFEDVGTVYVPGDTDTYVAEAAGFFEETFSDSGIKVEIQQSVDDNEATLMERGELTFGNRMTYPYLLNKQAGADIVAVWNSGNPDPEIVTVITRSDSEANSFSDLRGGKIASSAAGCPYSVLVELADEQGWTKGSDFEHVNTKEYTTALLSGEVDAIVYHPDWNTISALLSGEAKVIGYAKENGVYTGGGGSRVLFCPTEYAKKNPNVVKGYIKLMELVSAYLVSNPYDAGVLQESLDRTPAAGTYFWIQSAIPTYYTSQLSLADIKDNLKTYNEWLLEKDENFTTVLDFEDGVFDDSYFAK